MRRITICLIGLGLLVGASGCTSGGGAYYNPYGYQWHRQQEYAAPAYGWDDTYGGRSRAAIADGFQLDRDGEADASIDYIEYPQVTHRRQSPLSPPTSSWQLPRSRSSSGLSGSTSRRAAENGSHYGQLNQNGVPKTVYVRGYFRKDGTYVRSHYRSRPGSNP